MDRLPQELVDRISSFLDYADLKNTLLLSRSFQHAAERCSNAFHSFTLTEENADKFVETYGGRRLRYLRNVEFRTSFPALKLYKYDNIENVHQPEEYEDTKNKCRETKEELDRLDEDFTRQMNSLFSMLKRFESLGMKNIHLTIFTPTREASAEEWGLQRSFVSWRVHLLTPENLTSLASVRVLTVKAPEENTDNYGVPSPSLRKLDARVLLDLATKLPSLTTLRCEVGGDEWHEIYQLRGDPIFHYILHDWEGPRRDSRHDFGKALDIVALPNLRHAYLDFLFPLSKVEYIDQRWSVPNLTSPAAYDPFSTSLRLLSYQLRTLHLRVLADETLFWPTSGEAPFWPNLESMHVVFHMSTPSGSWYFRGLPGIGEVAAPEIEAYPPLADTDKDEKLWGVTSDMPLDRHPEYYMFRLEPNEETLVPFLTAFAKAAAEMPSLKDFAIWSPLRFDFEDEVDYEELYYSLVSNDDPDDDYDAHAPLAWGIAYTRPHEGAFATDPGVSFSSYRQIWWRTGKWRPGNELHRHFQHIGRKMYGEQMLEYYSDGGLLRRTDFEIHGSRTSGL